MSEAGSTGRPGADGVKARIERMRDRLLHLSKTLPLEQRLRDGLSQGTLSALAAVVAYLPTQALGLREGFWGAITALAVAQAELGAARSTGRDQLAGATIGGGIGVATVLTIGAGLPGYVLAVVISVLACWCVNIASASRLAAITATIILLVPHTGTPQHMLLSRVGEVGWGALVALGLVWLRERVTRR
ncbi:FUSC family protein [Muricoccus pecuniae]|uniref:Putative membrane protein YccC n=1 Tax=Muricoccus pecuniae TaxID=693023 RepID=A0A840YM59_9PROT|nr:FUSC family protein [Roseomonas pecuniae]MBB5695624.1 putative membrane protein YccC [Roseomonas pecuniae]